MFKTIAANSFFKRYWPLLVLLVLFAASLGVRAGAFGIDPVKKNALTHYNVFNNTDVFIHNNFVLEIYEKHPASEHMFAGYIGGGPYLQHKSLPYTVYTSFPPTHFVALYAVLKPFNAVHNFAAWQVFGLAIQLACILLLFYLVYLLTRNKWLAVLAASIYVFSTGALHFHMNAFWAHQLLQPVFLASLVVFVRRGGLFKPWQALAFGFSMSLIAWTGVVGVVGYVLYAAFMFYKTRDRAYLSYLWMFGGMVAAVVLTFVHVLLATGSDPLSYVRAVKGRITARTATGGLIPFPQVIWNYISNLFLEYGGYIVLAYTLALRRKLKDFEWAVLFVASFPLVETLILLEHDTIYGFGRLKWIVPLALVIALFASRYVKTRKGKIALIATVVGVNILHIASYFVIYWL